MTYSVAIRTLGRNNEWLEKEVDLLRNQTVKPKEIRVFEGVGMVKQRAQDYSVFDSDFVLLLDDDVKMESGCVERLIREMETGGYDVIAPDTYENQGLSWKYKVYAALTNWTFPRRGDNWAFKILPWGSFSYNNSPKKGVCYPSMYCAGPALLWRRDSLIKLRIEDEVWLDEKGFAYSDDTLETYKAYRMGMKLGVLYDGGCEHLNAKTASMPYMKRTDRFYVRSWAMAAVWKRLMWRDADGRKNVFAALLFGMKMWWVFWVYCVVALIYRDMSIPSQHIRGVREALKMNFDKSV